jgi:hypothetical protein
MIYAKSYSLKKNSFLTAHCLLLFFVNLISLKATPFYKTKGGDVSALQFEHREYNWQLQRKPFVLATHETLLPALILQDKRSYEYVYDSQKKLHLLATIHKIIKINTVEALENFNKVYLPANDIEQIWILKARCINPNGKIIELPSEAIRDIESWEQNGKEKIFAIEGAEVGCEIEYFYTIEKSLKYFGVEVFQSPFLTKSIDFEIISPTKLVFHAQVYNHTAAQLQQTTTKYRQKNTLLLHLDSLEGLEQEPFAQYEANLMRIDYKLSYSENPQQKLFTWDDAATFFYQKIYAHRNSKKDYKEINSNKEINVFLQKILKNTSNDTDKIQKIEAYIKTNFQHIRTANAQTIAQIWENKFANTEDLVRLFAYLFDQAHITHQLVLTTDQYQADLENNFENWLYLEKYLFYFPQINQYLAPIDVAYRLGNLPHSYHRKKGVFMDTQLLGGMLHTQFKSITTVLPTAENLKLLLSLQPEEQAYNLSFEQTFQGHYAILLGHHYQIATPAQQQEQLRYLTSSFTKQLGSTEVVLSSNKDFSICGTAKAQELIGLAGQHLILQIGKLLRNNYGELATTHIRKQPLLFDFPKKTTYQLQFEIPQGYIIRNLEAMNAHSSYRNALGEGLSFQAHYELDGNTVLITITEELNMQLLPTEEYGAFYKVIEEIQKFKDIKLVINKL